MLLDNCSIDIGHRYAKCLKKTFLADPPAHTQSQKHKFFIIPEEINLPEILKTALKIKQEFAAFEQVHYGVENVVKDSRLNALHILMLPINGPAPDFGAKTFESAKIKLENYLNHHIEMELSREEEISLLYAADVLKKANLMFQLEGQN